jgi:predicted RNase H-like nuclease (RuvC/YqgF family)
MYSVEIKNNKEIYEFCMLNGITDINKFIQDCFKQGFDIKKYGLLGKTGGEDEKQVEIEVIREKRVEIPVEVIKEVEIIKEIPIEVIKEIIIEKEVIKEVPVEKIVSKIEYISDKNTENELFEKIEQLVKEKQEFSIKLEESQKEVQIFSTKITEMENIFQNEMSKKDMELDELRRNLDIPIDENKVKMLETTLQNLRKDLKLKNEKINELEDKLKNSMTNNSQTGAVYMKGSNIIENL